jgi:hypothetical protein
MDVRGPTRAAAKRLTTGMVVACAAAAVCAPAAMAGSVSNVHPKPIDPATGLPDTSLPDAPSPAGYSAGPGEGNAVTLGFGGGGVVFGDAGVGDTAGTAVTMTGTDVVDVENQWDTCFPD